MKTIQELISNIPQTNILGDANLVIKKLCFDSRHIGGSTLFFAIKGTSVDGHSYIQDVIEKGAIAIVCEVLPSELNSKVTYISVENSTAAMGIMAAAF